MHLWCRGYEIKRLHRLHHESHQSHYNCGTLRQGWPKWSHSLPTVLLFQPKPDLFVKQLRLDKGKWLNETGILQI